MDLTDDIRCKLYNWVKSDLSEERSKVVDRTIIEMRDIVADWIIGRIDDKIMKASRSVSKNQIQYYRNISFTKENLEINKDELFDKISRVSRRYYNYYISINMDDKKIPYFPWFKQFTSSIQSFIESPRERMMYRELQNLALRIYREDYKLEKFDHDYCLSDGWGWYSASTFLKPQGVESIEQFQEKFPEWYEKYYILRVLVDEPERPNIFGYNGLIGILKK
jgi:hypothetical protein